MLQGNSLIYFIMLLPKDKIAQDEIQWIQKWRFLVNSIIFNQ
jgi:hypothetical protein